MKARYLIPALTLLIGVGAGWLLPRQDATGGSGVVPDRPGSGRMSERGQGGSRGQGIRWDSKVAEELADGDPLVTVPTGLVRGISKLPPIRSCREDLFRREDAVIDLLKITDHERQMLEEHWSSFRHKIEDLEVSTSRSRVNEDGSVQITVPDLSRSLGPVGERFSDTVKQVIGPERGHLLLAMKQTDQVFAPETGERSYHVRVEAVGDGSWRYHTRYEDDENHRVWVGEGIPPEIRHITDAARIEPSLREFNES